MCTALHLCTRDHYFGRTLDLDRSYGEEVCILPRRAPIAFRRMGVTVEHHAMIGMATVVGDTPLFYDATNEHGLSMAGLNFPENAYYAPAATADEQVAPFEFIPWILSQCKDLDDVRRCLEKLCLVNIPFSDQLPLSPLHWMIADRTGALVVEPMRDGLHIHENPVGVMTNNPPFPYHLAHLVNFRGLSVENGENRFAPDLALECYCQGLGALGLPGDLSSMSRFVRAAFGRSHSVCEGDEDSSVSQFFHLLGTVEMPRGLCRTEAGTWDITGYTSCVNTDRGLYYYTTYENRAISCVDLHRADLDGTCLLRYPLAREAQIRYQN